MPEQLVQNIIQHKRCNTYIPTHIPTVPNGHQTIVTRCTDPEKRKYFDVLIAQLVEHQTYEPSTWVQFPGIHMTTSGGRTLTWST